VFRQLFQQICQEIDPFPLIHHDFELSFSQFAEAIEAAFSQYAIQIIRGEEWDGCLHRATLIRFKDVWATMYTNVTCLSCLARSPEDTLSCHHALCTTCTTTYGQASNAEPWTFWIDTCPLCGIINLEKFVHKPDTAGVRALIAEGGGVRGIVPLSFLSELEAVVNLPMNIGEHFDIALGSSSGMSSLLRNTMHAQLIF